MALLDGHGIVLDFLKGLPPKQKAQISHAIWSLGANPLPADHAQLKGYASYLRIDVGEYRVIYQYDDIKDIVTVILIGKRNGDEVYKLLKRLLG